MIRSIPLISHLRMDRSHLTERILQLSLEIIYLLTGERFPPVMPGDHLTIKVPPPHSLTMERNDEKKILEVTQKIIELLTGEVPIRCQDVSVYFSMEEWEYLEGHKDVYKDVVMENEPPLTSPDILSRRPQLPVSPSPNCLNRDPRNFLQSLSAKSSLAEQNTIHLLEVITKTSCEREEELLGSDMPRPAHHAQSTSTHVKEEPLSAEEHLPNCDISKTMDRIQGAGHITGEQVSTKGHRPHPDLSILAYPTQGSSTLIKEEPLSAEEHLPNSDISKTMDHIQGAGHITGEQVSTKGHLPHPDLSILTYPTQGSSTLIKKEPLSAEEHLKSDISKTMDHIQGAGHITGEQVSSKGHLPHPNLSILAYPTQGSSTLIKEEPLSAEEHLHLEVSKATAHAQSAPAHVKEESEHVPSSENSGTDRPQYHFADIKSESQLCAEKRLLNLEASMSTKDADYVSVRIKEEPLFGEAGGVTEGDTSTLTLNGSVDNSNSDFHPPEVEQGHLGKNVCFVCEKRFRSKAALLAHQGIHNGHKSHSCSECGKSFTRNSSLVSHWRFHTGEKPYTCSMCGAQFITNSALAWHRRSHTDEKPFLCPDCGKSFFTNASLKKHQKIHAAERPFSCSECGKGFTSNSDLIKHQRIHTGVRPYSCSLCDKCFITKSDLAKHQKVHTVEKLFPCADCTMSFLTSYALLKHRKIHAADKPFSCPECRKRFTSSFDLEKHQKFHLEEKLHACSECGKRFSTRQGMVKHQRLHSGVRPFSCSDCGKCFMRSSDLARHQQGHRGERPFQCPECLKSFSRKQTLLAHQKTHADGKLFSCSVCGKRFTSSLDLEEHQKVHLEEKL